MFQDRITLNEKEILEKEFPIVTRGYDLQEVDKYLDIVIRDYHEYNNIIRLINRDRKSLIEENNKLKKELRNLKSGIEAVRNSDKEITNVDLLRRISQLEKIVLGKYE